MQTGHVEVSNQHLRVKIDLSDIFHFNLLPSVRLLPQLSRFPQDESSLQIKECPVSETPWSNPALCQSNAEYVLTYFNIFQMYFSWYRFFLLKLAWPNALSISVFRFLPWWEVTGGDSMFCLSLDCGSWGSWPKFASSSDMMFQTFALLQCHAFCLQLQHGTFA